MQIKCEYNVNTMQIRCKYNEIQCKYSANTTQIQCKYNTNTLNILLKYKINTIQIQNTKCKHCEKKQKIPGQGISLYHFQLSGPENNKSCNVTPRPSLPESHSLKMRMCENEDIELKRCGHIW